MSPLRERKCAAAQGPAASCHDSGPDPASQDFERLEAQAACLEDVTRRLIGQSGIQPGMRVLNIGCGLGAVAILLAEAVGPWGSVVAVDGDQHLIDAARRRAFQQGYGQIKFSVDTDEPMRLNRPFDAAVGRHVLVHRADPVVALRRAVGAVKSGGIVAFQEPALLAGGHAWPEVPLWQQLCTVTNDALRRTVASPDVASGLVAYFEDAGLPEPESYWQSVVGGSACPLLASVVLTYQALRSRRAEAGPGCAESPGAGLEDLPTLHDRVAEAGRAKRAQFVSAPEACAWAVRG